MAGGAYLFLHYALLVAYIAQGGDILLSGAQKLLPFLPQSLPGWTAPALFTSVFGGSLVFGNKKLVEDVRIPIIYLTMMTCGDENEVLTHSIDVLTGKQPLRLGSGGKLCWSCRSCLLTDRVFTLIGAGTWMKTI